MARKKTKPNIFAPENRVSLIFISVSVGLILLLLIGMVSFIAQKPKTTEEVVLSNSVVIADDGRQIIEITAKNGFLPSSVTARAGVNTVLRVKTSNTIDCSNVLNIPSLGVSKQLPLSGNTDIEIPAQASGSEISGTCSVGHYSFRVKFL